MNAEPDLLLPREQTAWERAVERVSAERWPLDADIIRRAKNVWECPPELLPYLAYEFSVDIWDEAWSIAKKRSVIARAIQLARIKGTEAAIDEAISIAGGELVGLITPPASLYLSVSMTPEQRQAWLDRMPQLRIYPKRLPNESAGFHVGQHVGYHSYTLNSQAFFYAAPRVTLFRPGVGETELLTLNKRISDPTITDAEELLQVREPRPFAGMVLGGVSGLGPWYPRASTAREQVYTLRTRRTLEIPGTTQLAAELIGSGLEPIDVRSQPIVREPRPFLGLYVGPRSFLGLGLTKHIRRSRAHLQVYRRIFLHDPSIRANAQSGRTFLGFNFRFGQQPFTADLKVKVRQPRPPAAFQPFAYGFVLGSDTTAKTKVIEAVLTHQSRRDRILINTRTKAVATAGPGIAAGEQTLAGQIINV